MPGVWTFKAPGGGNTPLRPPLHIDGTPGLTHPGEIGAPTLNSKCLKEPTVEDCDTILLSWSYNSENKTCEKGFVCMDCVNRFENQNDCTKICSMVQARKPRRNKRNCRYWMSWGARCQDKWFEERMTKAGKMDLILLFTGCGPEKKKLYEYSYSRRKCHQVLYRAPRNPVKP
ncbi:uncharacterized protein LOC142564837 [Dermacentor variabilis]|uniref:uncharacterized protein LOC142564837 n=1 Tax=Dermacentor variabilis TaxID=34621 RepID=UPI003F5BE74B